VSYKTKKAATEAGKTELMSKLKGKGWKLRVHENLGWHYAADKGNVHVHPVHNRGEKPKFMCLIAGRADECGWGDCDWSTKFAHHDPIKVIKHELRSVQEVTNQKVAARRGAEQVLEEETQHV
jgi:hypothetical protein